MKRTAWVLAAGLVALLAGCGQKGALYLPDKNAQVVTTAAAPPVPAQSAPSTPPTPAPPKPTDRDDDSQAPK